jgi:predicted metal-dependent hydrolase
MSTRTRHIRVRDISVEIIRKDIKNLHLGVYPPSGRVRVAAPKKVNDAAVRLAVISRLRWIRSHQEKFSAQPREPKREMVSGESHFVFGRRYRLRVVTKSHLQTAIIKKKTALELHVRPGTTRGERDLMLARWYRAQLRERIPLLLSKWQERLEVDARAWGIRRMKTKWGSCNPKARRIWVNLELAKKPERCLEYLVVHELVHLLERGHSDRFVALMDKHMPRWRQHRTELNATPLSHENWTY